MPSINLPHASQPSTSGRAPTGVSASSSSLVPAQPGVRGASGVLVHTRDGIFRAQGQRVTIEPDQTGVQDRIEEPASGDLDGWMEMDLDETGFSGDMNTGWYETSRPPASGRASAARHKQASTWMNKVIPDLLPIFLAVLKESDNLRDLSNVTPLHCSCRGSGTPLVVDCISFDAIVRTTVCSCNAAAQLLSRGFFPCAPLHPSLAVDLNVLDLTARFFLRSSPGVTSWSEALEDYLGFRGYSLGPEGTLRVRFGNTMRWFTYLWDTIHRKAEELLEYVTPIVREDLWGNEANGETSAEDGGRDNGMEYEDTGDGDYGMEDMDMERASHGQHLGTEGASELDVDEEHGTSQSATRSGTLRRAVRVGGRRQYIRERPIPARFPRTAGLPARAGLKEPSLYLRRRCPLCFGGNKRHSGDVAHPDCLAQIDAVFTHKRADENDSQVEGVHRRDPSMLHPDTHFVSEDYAAQVEAEVEAARKRPAKEVPDPRVPDEVVDECQDSYKAANETSAKSNPSFFADTGLMTLLCRHDRCLFAVNMTSAGEKQFYSIALIRSLLSQLPNNWTLGLLYDIACVIERSCLKWNLLGSDISRIRFAVSIFHAYGHQYGCQLLYHPRKCIGCGLFDGEGCERFWSLLKGMIGILRVSGYHQRLYALDRRIHFLSHRSYGQFGLWLERKWKLCEVREHTARKALDEVLAKGITLEKLQKEWQDEIETETHSPVRATQRKISLQIDAIARLVELERSEKSTIKRLKKELMDSGSYRSAYEIQEEIKEAENGLERVDGELKKWKQKLGLRPWGSVSKALESEWGRLRLQALSLKNRLRDLLRHRKRELERSQRAFKVARNAANSGETKLDKRIISYVQGKDMSISRLRDNFHETWKKMKALQESGVIPLAAVLPKPIPKDRLWDLDVDDDIWNDAGLKWTESDLNGTQTGTNPDWMVNGDIRKGIQAMLEVDRCQEEVSQLCKERRILQEVAQERWLAFNMVIAGLEASDQDAMLFLFQQLKEDMLQTIGRWEENVLTIPGDYDVGSSWGPAFIEIRDARIRRHRGHQDESNLVDSRQYEEEINDQELEDQENIILTNLYESLEIDH